MSSANEEIPLAHIVETKLARGQVEKWLLFLEGDMKKSLRQVGS